jgi:hypothetical protein
MFLEGNQVKMFPAVLLGEEFWQEKLQPIPHKLNNPQPSQWEELNSA